MRRRLFGGLTAVLVCLSMILPAFAASSEVPPSESPSPDPSPSPSVVTAAAGLSVVQKIGGRPADTVTMVQGDMVEWAVTYENTGNVAITDSIMNAVLPSGGNLTYRVKSADDGTQAQISANKCVWTVPSLEPGESVSVTFVGTVADTAKAATYDSGSIMFNGYGYYLNDAGVRKSVGFNSTKEFSVIIDPVDDPVSTVNPGGSESPSPESPAPENPVETPDVTVPDDSGVQVSVKAIGSFTGNQNLEQSATAQIDATVSYKGLEKGKTYKLVCTLFDLDLGRQLVYGTPISTEKQWYYTDEIWTIDPLNGMRVTGGWSYDVVEKGGVLAAVQTVDFVADETYGGVSVSIPVDGRQLAGQRIIVNAEIREDEAVIGVSPAVAIGAMTEGTVTVPAVSVDLTASDKTKNVGVKSNAEMVANVNLKSLVAGGSYRIDAKLVTANDHVSISAGNGGNTTASSSFTASKTNMTQSLIFKLDTTNMNGKQFSVEVLLYDVSDASNPVLLGTATMDSANAVTVKTVANVQTGSSSGLSVPAAIWVGSMVFAALAVAGVICSKRRGV